MINGKGLGRCFRIRWSPEDHRISPLPPGYLFPRPSLLIITPNPGRLPGQRRILLYSASLFNTGNRMPRTLYFFQSKKDRSRTNPRPTLMSCGARRYTALFIEPDLYNAHPRSTTSFLTATTLVYATGAGITAGAGTRLFLQLFLERCFTPIPFQLRLLF